MKQLIMNESKLDAITELANISTGNAATALSEMVQTKVDLAVPFVRYLDVFEIPTVIGNYDLLVSGVYVTIFGDIDGYLVFITDNETYKSLAKAASGGMDIEPDLVLTEVVNIINGSYLTALSEMLDYTIDVTPPGTISDMLGSILSSFVSEISINTTKSILVSSTLIIDNSEFNAYQLLMMDEPSLSDMIKRLEDKYSL